MHTLCDNGSHALGFSLQGRVTRSELFCAAA
jgi:hypothetical protein